MYSDYGIHTLSLSFNPKIDDVINDTRIHYYIYLYVHCKQISKPKKVWRFFSEIFFTHKILCLKFVSHRTEYSSIQSSKKIYWHQLLNSQGKIKSLFLSIKTKTKKKRHYPRNEKEISKFHYADLYVEHLTSFRKVLFFA